MTMTKPEKTRVCISGEDWWFTLHPADEAGERKLSIRYDQVIEHDFEKEQHFTAIVTADGEFEMPPHMRRSEDVADNIKHWFCALERREAKPEYPLIGYWFHTFGDGKIRQQGELLDGAHNGYIAQLFDWSIGGRLQQIFIPFERLSDLALYESAGVMIEAYKLKRSQPVIYDKLLPAALKDA